MKRFRLLSGLTFLMVSGFIFILVSCASLPEPKEEGDSLVIGNLVLDFPDGFFDKSPRTIEYGVWIEFENITKKRKYKIRISEGYFYFSTNGTDEYLLKSYEYTKEIGHIRYNFGDSIMWKISTTPSKVIYLGHLTYSFSNPKCVDYVGTHYWHFEKSLDKKWNKNQVYRYLKDKREESPWLNYEILEYGK